MVFPVWKTIKLGVIKNGIGLRVATDKALIEISGWAYDLLSRSVFVRSTREMEIDLVKTSVVGLGFTKITRCDRIYERAFSLGLEMCGTEDGPSLRVQYTDQPKGERLRICSKLILSSSRRLRVFLVEHAGSKLHLKGFFAAPRRSLVSRGGANLPTSPQNSLVPLWTYALCICTGLFFCIKIISKQKTLTLLRFYYIINI
jgi:hypothetical protein